MAIIVDVPFLKKDEFKKDGGRWDAEMRTWYIPDHAQIENFEGWLPSECSMIIKSPFYLALAERTCWKCTRTTPLLSIGSDDYMEYQEEECSDGEDYSWQWGNEFILLESVTFLPAQIVHLIQTEYPFFQYQYSRQVGGKYWGNKCVHCGALQGDWFNHNEPDGAFFPCSAEEARAIRLVEMKFKYDFPIVGSVSFGDTTELIREYSQR